MTWTSGDYACLYSELPLLLSEWFMNCLACFDMIETLGDMAYLYCTEMSLLIRTTGSSIV